MIVGRKLPLLVLLLVQVSAVGCSPARTIEAAELLADIARRDPPETVQRTSIAYRAEQDVRRGDLYVPAETRAGLVLVPGAAEGALDDPRLIDFADALRRRGFRVLVPELAGEDFLQVSAEDAEAIADAAHHLLASGARDRIGMAALSYAVARRFARRCIRTSATGSASSSRSAAITASLRASPI